MMRTIRPVLHKLDVAAEYVDVGDPLAVSAGRRGLRRWARHARARGHP